MADKDDDETVESVTKRARALYDNPRSVSAMKGAIGQMEKSAARTKKTAEADETEGKK